MSTTGFTLTPDELHELVQLSGDLFNDGERCAEAGVWRLAILSLGGAVEAAIIATAACLEPELRARGVWPAPGNPRHWTLGQAVRLGKDAGWFPTVLAVDANDVFAGLRGEVGDALSFVVRVRNMVVHPGAYLREEARPDLADREHMQPTYDVLCGIADKVFEQLNAALEAIAPT